MTVRDRLSGAIGTGEVIGINHHGGSQPGAFRDIAPIAIEGDILRARCYTSGAVKLFAIDKIEIRPDAQTPEDKANAWQHGHVHQPCFNSLAELFAARRQALEALGWIVAHDVDEFGEGINLRRAFKNGKLIKTPVVSLRYEEIGFEALATEDGRVVMRETGPRTRPWIVRAKNLTTARTYADCENAAELFFKCADELKP